MDIKPNTACCNPRCVKAQEVYQVRRGAGPPGGGGCWGGEPFCSLLQGGAGPPGFVCVWGGGG
jgi:hypothetical protein